MKKENNIKMVSGYFLNEEDLLRAIKTLKEMKVQIQEVFTPFPIHGLDNLLGLKKSKIPMVGFIFGSVGAIGAFLFQAWVFTKSYPLNIGGKPFFSVPTFIPIIFETTVLFAAIAMVFAFLFRSKLGLGAANKVYDPKVTDDHFLILLKETKENKCGELVSILQQTGAEEVKEIE